MAARAGRHPDSQHPVRERRSAVLAGTHPGVRRPPAGPDSHRPVPVPVGAVEEGQGTARGSDVQEPRGGWLFGGSRGSGAQLRLPDVRQHRGTGFRLSESRAGR